MSRFLLIILSAAIFAGCRKTTPDATLAYEQSYNNSSCVLECLRIGTRISFKGYEKEDVQNIILYKYPYNNNFKNELKKETLVYDGEIQGSFRAFNVLLNDSFDYVVEVPAADTSYYIHSGLIPFTKDTVESGPHGCGYELPCASYAPYVLVNGDTAKMWARVVGSNGYRAIHNPYLILEK